MPDTEFDAERITQDVVEKYQQFVNPTQVALLKIGGFDHIEAEGGKAFCFSTSKVTNTLTVLGGYGVFSLGHRHPRVVRAVKDQLDLIPLSSKTFLNKPLADPRR